MWKEASKPDQVRVRARAFKAHEAGGRKKEGGKEGTRINLRERWKWEQDEERKGAGTAEEAKGMCACVREVTVGERESESERAKGAEVQLCRCAWALRRPPILHEGCSWLDTNEKRNEIDSFSFPCPLPLFAPYSVLMCTQTRAHALLPVMHSSTPRLLTAERSLTSWPAQRATRNVR